jgi:hypothetical protein
MPGCRLHIPRCVEEERREKRREEEKRGGCEEKCKDHKKIKIQKLTNNDQSGLTKTAHY